MSGQTMRRVLLGTPALTGDVSVFYAHAAEQTLLLGASRGIDVRTLRIAYESILPNARNDIIAAAVEQDFSDLIMIDADQDWDPEWFFRLLEYPVDCVGAAVRKKTDQEELYNVRSAGGPMALRRHPELPILTAPDMALGCGFIRFSRAALLSLWDSSQPYSVWRGKQSRWAFEYKIENGVLVGEDTVVSDKLRALGIDTWVDPNMTCGHHGLKRYAGDFATWIKAQRMAESARQVGDIPIVGEQ